MKVLILGANGNIAKIVATNLKNNRIETVLTSRTGHDDIQALDATDTAALAVAMQGVDIVYSNVGPDDMPPVANAVINAMGATGTPRLIWIATIGILNELSDVNKEAWTKMLGTPDDPTTYFGDQAQAARLIEDSDVNYTIIRPNELTDENKMDDINVQVGAEQIVGGPISRISVANFVTMLIEKPDQYQRENISISGK